MWERHAVQDGANVATLLGTLEYFDWISGLISVYTMKIDNKISENGKHAKKWVKWLNCQIKDLLKRARRLSITAQCFENNWEAKRKKCIKKS